MSDCKEDLSDLPGLEEEGIDGKEFRPRSSSGGLKSLMKFKTRTKSGDVNKAAHNEASTDDKQKGFKGFLDNFPFRPRSKSDAAALKQAAMMRKKHPSGGNTAVQQMLNDSQQAQLGSSGDLEPVQRARSTSLGAKDRLRMMKLEKERRMSGAVNGNQEKTTIMGKLISNGFQSESSSSMETEEQHQYTGQALIWEPGDDGDEMSRGKSSYLDRVQVEDIEVNDPMVYYKFMRAHKCYDIIPTSSKLVVFDTSLSVKKAFYALVYNCVRAAPLWDHKRQAFVGMLTISDFIFILTKYYVSPEEKMQELEEHQISSWREELAHKYQPFVSISPEASVCEAVRRLTNSKVHRLPVVDPVSGNVVFIITHKRILKFIHLFMKNLPKPAYINQSIGELNLGTYSSLATVNADSSLIHALRLFVERRVSALPVLDSNGQVTDLYAKFDVINLAAEKTYNNLDVPISQALASRNKQTESVMCCLRTDSLSSVIDCIVKAGVHRLVIQTTDGKLDGIISLSDILAFLMQDRKLSQTSVVNQPLLSERLCQPTLSYVPAEQQNSMMTT